MCWCCKPEGDIAVVGLHELVVVWRRVIDTAVQELVHHRMTSGIESEEVEAEPVMPGGIDYDPTDSDAVAVICADETEPFVMLSIAVRAKVPETGDETGGGAGGRKLVFARTPQLTDAVAVAAAGLRKRFLRRCRDLSEVLQMGTRVGRNRGC